MQNKEDAQVKDETQMENAAAESKDANAREASVGMMLRVGSHNRFSGIIKQRFEDFAVREVDKEGIPVRLTDFKHIDPELDASKEDKEKTCPFSAEEKKTVEEFIEKGERGHEEEQIALIATDRSKEDKLLIHEYVRKTFNLRSFTRPLKNVVIEGKEENKVETKKTGSELVICWRSNKKNSAHIGRHKPPTNPYPEGVPDFCHFTVQKQNMDTNFVITLFTKFLHCEPKRFSYAGTKDKRAVAYQRMSAFKISSKRLSDMNRICSNMGVGNFSYSDQNIKLGDLSGNQFTCVIRDVDGATEEEISVACKSLRDQGFINYFGLQRFGSFSNIPTCEIGKALIQSRWEDAANMVLTPREGENHSIMQAKECWQSNKDAEAACKLLPNWAYGHFEGKLLTGLRREGVSYKEAFKQMPYQMRTLYLHSYQSYIFNNALSKRLEKHGFTPIEGDLVLVPQPEGKPVVKVLDKTTCENHSIFDIVMPLPGYDVTYPSHSAEVYTDLLGCDGLDTDMVTKSKDNSLSGDYRHIMVKPKELTWDIRKYTNHEVSLTSNDFLDITGFSCSDMTKKRVYFPKSNQTGANVTAEKSVEEKTETDTSEVTADAEEDNISVKGEQVKAEEAPTPEDTKPVESVEPVESTALRLTFTLPTSSYATCAFRELLTSDCSLEAQVELNKKFDDKSKDRNDNKFPRDNRGDNRFRNDRNDNRKRKGSNNRGHFNKKKRGGQRFGGVSK